MLGRHAVSILNESLELVVLCEGDDLQHGPKLGENLEGRQRDSRDNLFLYNCSEIIKSRWGDFRNTVHILN